MILFATHLRQHHEVPHTPTNLERVQSFRARSPLAFCNNRSFPARFPSAQPAPAGLSEAGTCNTSALPGAAGGAEKGRVERPFPDCGNPSRRGLNPGNYNPDPPTPDEVAEAYRFKYSQEGK